MCPRRLIASVCAIACLAVASTAVADPVRLLVVTGTGQGLADAARAFVAKHGEGLLDVRVATEEVPADAIEQADAVFVYYVRNELLREITPGLRDAQDRGALVLGAPRDTVEQVTSLSLDRTHNDPAERYWQYGGADNLRAFLELTYAAAGGTAPLAVPPPLPALAQGIYHPRAPRVFDDLEAYLQWHAGASVAPADAPVVALTFYSNNVKFADTAHIDALIAALEARRLRPLPIFGWPTSSLDALLWRNGACVPGVILSFNLTVFRSDDAAALERCGAQVINLMVTREAAADWADSVRGLPGDRISTLLNVPERSGAVEPVLVATMERDAAGVAVSRPIAERIERVADRAARWIALRSKPNHEKSVAILYYNNPPGRGNLGASYLSVFPTLVTLLARLREAGYDTGTALPDERAMMALLQQRGRNIEQWAPGELEAMVDRGEVTLVSLRDYERWFAELPARFRQMVLAEWGQPGASRLMTVTRRGERMFVLPGLRFGKIFVGPQPLRSTFERAVDLAHDPLTPIPHSYVASYLYYRRVLNVDAIVHIGRHGTLEWLPGKQTAQAGWDHAEVLLGDIPNPYLYIVEGGGEAIQAKRRGAAVMMSHLTPLIVAGGEQETFGPLHALLDRYEIAHEATPELAREYEDQIRTEVRRLRLDEQLGLNLDADPWATVYEKIHTFAHAVEEAPIPAGMHALGQLPADAVQRDAVAEFLKRAFADEERPAILPFAEDWASAVFDGRPFHPDAISDAGLRSKIEKIHEEAVQWLARLRASATMEVEALVTVLAGRYLPSGPLGDPLGVPDALPTGRNQHGFDSAFIPTKAAWALGQKMAAQMLARFKADRGRYPERVSLMLWYGETEKHQGAMESMALSLLGVEPVWTGRGTMEGVRLIPDEQMTHPRIDVVVTVTGIYRDGFPDKISLLDRAVRLAASAGPSPITRHDDEVRQRLVAAGVDANAAAQFARARVFGNKPGQYGIGLQQMAEQSLDAGASDKVAEVYFHHTNYAFSDETWGATAPGALEAHLRTNEAVLFSRSGNLYGALDNDDTYAYVGGLHLATKAASGTAPAFYIHNLRHAGAESVTDMQTWLATELNARAWNPKWLREMQRSGYAGAREMLKELEHLYGFQATSPEQMSGQFWQGSYDVYVADKHGLDMGAFFERENPHAKQWMLSRLLEVDRQGSYRYSPEERATLVRSYIRSVNRHGVSCSANTCGNLRVHQYLAQQAATVPGLSAAELEAFGRRIGAATQWSSSSFRGAPAPLMAGVSRATRRERVLPTPRRETPAPEPAVVDPPRTVRGFAMTERTINVADRASFSSAASAPLGIAILLLIAAGAGIEARRSLRRV